MGCPNMNVKNQIGCHVNCMCLISKNILVCAKTLYISSNLVTLVFLCNTVIVRNCMQMLSHDNRSTKLPPTYLAGISLDVIHETSQFTRWQHYIGGKLKRNILLNGNAKMIL